MSDLTKILAENQEEMLKLLAPAVKKSITFQNLQNSDSEPENVFPNTTSTPARTKTIASKATPMNSRNNDLRQLENIFYGITLNGNETYPIL